MITTEALCVLGIPLCGQATESTEKGRPGLPAELIFFVASVAKPFRFA